MYIIGNEYLVAAGLSENYSISISRDLVVCTCEHEGFFVVLSFTKSFVRRTGIDRLPYVLLVLQGIHQVATGTCTIVSTIVLHFFTFAV
jgi:hypothetical protein